MFFSTFSSRAPFSSSIWHSCHKHIADVHAYYLFVIVHLWIVENTDECMFHAITHINVWICLLWMKEYSVPCHFSINLSLCFDVWSLFFFPLQESLWLEWAGCTGNFQIGSVLSLSLADVHFPVISLKLFVDWLKMLNFALGRDHYVILNIRSWTGAKAFITNSIMGSRAFSGW